MNFTPEQLQAINLEGTNIIVSAGAGSGKTAVLSERVLRKVKEGIDIRKILILTFTNEAAGEMKERIRKKLKKSGLNEALKYIDSAYITTFDAYALSLVKKYHYYFNISNNIKIIDASIIDLKKEEILDKIFLDLYNKKDKKFLKLVGDFTTRDDDIIKKAILNINKLLDLKYNKKEYLTNYITNFYQEENINNLFLEYFNYLKELTNLIESELYSLEDYMDSKAYLKVYDAYSSLLNPKCYNDLFKVKNKRVQFRSLDSDGIPIKEALKAHVKEVMELTIFSEEELINSLLSTKDYVESIIDIILKLDLELTNYKFKEEAFEFVDISKMAIKLVNEHSDVRFDLQNSYQEILIDEYQDTNDLQEEFIKEIANNNVYMVGDIKQSIYRFRNANPNIFKEKYICYSKNIGGTKIDLAKNFRSREEVLNNINLIFNSIMTNDIGGISYKENHNMIYGNMAYKLEGKTNQDNNMTILEYDNDNKEFNDTEIEIFTIAKDILAKINSNYQVYDFDLGSKRKVTFKDFAIILDRGSAMPLYKKIFEYLNIPLDVYKDNDLVSANDILIIKNIINLILKIYHKSYDKEMQYYFTSIARSFLSDLSDAEIFKYLNEFTFYESSIYKTCQDLAKDLEHKTPSILLNEIIIEFNFYYNLIKVGDINTSLIRLDNLMALAYNAEDLGFTIEDFSNYLENIIDSNKEIRYREAKDNSDSVKIMNIHKSKGLEFPICYFAGFKKSFNLADLKSRFMFDNKYGILTPYFKEGIGTLFIKTLIKNKYYNDEISEKIRLFYVALTRAKEKIIMVIPKFNQEGETKEVNRILGLSFRSFYDFINAISLNLKEYIKELNINQLGLTKDYLYFKSNNFTKENNNLKITFIENNMDSIVEDNLHASKTLNKLLTLEEAKKLDYGTSIHNMLELTDFKKPSTNKWVGELQKAFDFKKAIIYQELEFCYEKDSNNYHGIIDLMLEYEDNIKIIDYKLKNIDDDAYIKQLNVYYDYIKKVSDKEIKLYLYSILDNKLKEINVNELVLN